MPDEKTRPATAAEIRRLIGDYDDAVVSLIMETRASAADVLRAVQWFRGSTPLEDEAGQEPHGAVRAVYEILKEEEPPEEP